MAKKKKNQNGAGFAYKSNRPKLDLADHVSGLVNPFDDRAKGSKIHDANSSNTFAYQSVQVYDVSVNELGMGYAQFYPNIKTAIKEVQATTAHLPTTGITGAAATFTSTDIDTYGSVEPLTHKFRIVSWGIRVQSLVNALNAKGRVLIRQMSDDQAAASQNVLKLPAEYVSLAHTHDMDYTIIPNHQNDKYQEFIEPDATYGGQLNDNYDDPGYKSISLTLDGFEGSGTVDTQVVALTVEIVYNLEIIPRIGTLGVRVSSEPAPHSHEVLEAVHNTKSQMATAVPTKGLLSTVKKLATKSLSAVGRYALNRLTNGLSGYVEEKLLPAVGGVISPNNGMLRLTNG